ncbi:transposable element Tc1 transposase [Trichonephila clavipes]|nr:transposable element Tc1 transposase [Trichonephila clavipes]
MRPLEDAVKNESTMVDFSVMMVAVDLEPKQIERTEELSDQQYLGLIFQQDNARPHMACVAINSLTACQTLPWPARLPDLSPIEHVWDTMGRRLHLPGNVDDLVRQ